MQISFLLLIPEGWDLVDGNALCVCESELFPSCHLPAHRPLELIQRQLKRVRSNWRPRPAINLGSAPWTCHTA